MNAIESDFLKVICTLAKKKTNARDYNTVATELAGRVERFVTWLIRDYSSHPFRFEIGEFDIWDEGGNIIYFPDLYQYFISEVDGK